jgi:hypothetical protein
MPTKPRDTSMNAAVIMNVRCSREYRRWVNGLARSHRMDAVEAVELGLRDLAAKLGHDVPEPPRQPKFADNK